MNAIPDLNLRRILPPSQTYATPNPPPPRLEWPAPLSPTVIGPGGVVQGGNAIPGVSPQGT